MAIISASVLCIILPFFLKWAEKKSSVIRTLSPVLIAYGVGLLVGNLFPSFWDTAFNEMITQVAVLLAIPLLLIQNNPIKAIKGSGKAFLSFLLGCVAVCFSVFVVYQALKSEGIADLDKMGAMLVGVYTGGTPNLTAIGLAVEAPKESFAALYVFDTLLCGIYLLFLLTIAQRLLNYVFPASKTKSANNNEQNSLAINWKHLPWSILVSLGCIALAIGVSFLLSGKLSPMLLISTLSIAAIGASFSPRVRQLSVSYVTGDYFILVFCIAIGLQSDFSAIAEQSLSVFKFVLYVLGMAILLHYLLAFIFRIDVNTLLITSTAALFGPAFIGLMASRLKDKDLIIPGMSTGILGYAVANFLGLAIYGLLS